MEAKLVVINGPSSGVSIKLKRQETIVGRSNECDIRTKAQEISRKHCKFSIEKEKVMIEDLDSLNGTWVNGTKIQEKTELKNADTISIGNLMLRFLLSDLEPPVLELSSGSVFLDGDPHKNTTEKSFLDRFESRPKSQSAAEEALKKFFENR